MWPPRRTQILSYLQWLQTVLNLTEWTVNLATVPADEGNAAEVQPVDDCRVANIYLAPDFLNYTPQEIRRYLIHELLHLHHQEIEQVLAELAGSLAVQEHRLASRLHHHACEVMVDQLAYAIADLLEQTGLDTKQLARVKP